MPIMNLTESDFSDAILKALEDKPKPGREPGTITTGELARDYDVGLHRATKILGHLFDEGIVERDYVKRVDGWGGRAATKGYRLIREKDNGIPHSTNDSELA